MDARQAGHRRKVERVAAEVAQCGRNHYTPERFWQVYHRENFEAAKRSLDPRGVLPLFFDTFHRVD